MYYNNRKLALNFFWVILGVLLVVLSIAEILDSSVYAGIGGALTAVGILQIIRNLRYRKDPEFREKIDVEISDERLRFLRMKSWSMTGYIVLLTEAAVSVAAMVLGHHTVQLILGYCVCFTLIIYLITYMILNKKY